MKQKEIQELLEFISNLDLNEVNIETEQIKLSVVKRPEQKVVSEPYPQPAAAAPVTQETPSKGNTDETPESSDKYVTIKSPMIGTYYAAPSPDTDSFVKEGDKITAGKTVCVIEAMKLFNEIESEISGTIVKILVQNATPVEYDQPLFLVDPS